MWREIVDVGPDASHACKVGPPTPREVLSRLRAVELAAARQALVDAQKRVGECAAREATARNALKGHRSRLASAESQKLSGPVGRVRQRVAFADELRRRLAEAEQHLVQRVREHRAALDAQHACEAKLETAARAREAAESAVVNETQATERQRNRRQERQQSEAWRPPRR